MRILEQIMIANKQFVANVPERFTTSVPDVSKIPRRQLAIFTCMDTRLVDFLEPALGIKREEAIVIKNAGNSVTGIFETTLQSLIIGIFELNVKEIMVIGHEDCGVAHATAEVIKTKMLERGIAKEAIKMIEEELESWLDRFRHPEDNVREVVKRIRAHPFIPIDVPVHGLMFNPYTGLLHVIADGYTELAK